MALTNEDLQAIALLLKPIGDSIKSLEQKVDSLEQKVDSLEQRVDSLEQKVDSLEQKVISLEERMTKVENRLTKVEVEMENGFRKTLEAVNENINLINEKNKKYDTAADKVEMLEADMRLMKIAVNELYKKVG